MHVVRMQFQRGLRIGAPGWGLEESDKILGADTLYSALAQASVELYDELLPEDFRISSGFPFIGETLFFPRPMLPLSILSDSTLRLTYGKAIKELTFLKYHWFLEWLKDSQVDLEDVLASSGELKRCMKSVTRPRVALDRIDSSSTPYFSTEYRFSPGAGLFCLVDCDETLWKRVKALFRYLGDSGIGGEKTSGMGLFDVEFSEIDLPVPHEHERCTNLSPVIPRMDEVSYVEQYQLKERGGWIYSSSFPGTARKKKVSIVAEGSVFSRPARGQIVDVAPPNWPHKVFRYGLGLYAAVR